MNPSTPRYFLAQGHPDHPDEWSVVDARGDEQTVPFTAVAHGTAEQMKVKLADLERPTFATTAADSMGPAFTVTLIPEGVWSRDGRQVESGATSWRDEILPLPLMDQRMTGFGHEGAVVVGRIESISRDGDLIRGTGHFGRHPDAQEAAEHAATGQKHFVSVDPGAQDFTILPPEPKGDEVDGAPLQASDMLPRRVYNELEIAGATMVAVPAFAEAQIQVEAPQPQPQATAPVTQVVTAAASGVPLRAPKSWFERPQVDGAPPVTITRDGRVFGYIAPKGMCHVGLPGACLTEPVSASNYAHFRTGRYETAEGELVAVGRLVFGADHAPKRNRARQVVTASEAMAWYENNANIGAFVNCGHDDKGTWVAGAVNPALADEQLVALRGSDFSGDYRSIAGNRELVGVLAVGASGYPTPQVEVLVASAGDEAAMFITRPSEQIVPELIEDPYARRYVEQMQWTMADYERRFALVEEYVLPILAGLERARLSELIGATTAEAREEVMSRFSAFKGIADQEPVAAAATVEDVDEDVEEVKPALSHAMRLIRGFTGEWADGFKDFPPEKRKKMADAGTALPDGSYPIETCDDAMNARQSLGRASGNRAQVVAHIAKREKALNCDNGPLPAKGAARDDVEGFQGGPGLPPIETCADANKARVQLAKTPKQLRSRLASYIGERESALKCDNGPLPS